MWSIASWYHSIASRSPGLAWPRVANAFCCSLTCSAGSRLIWVRNSCAMAKSGSILTVFRSISIAFACSTWSRSSIIASSVSRRASGDLVVSGNTPGWRIADCAVAALVTASRTMLTSSAVTLPLILIIASSPSARSPAQPATCRRSSKLLHLW